MKCINENPNKYNEIMNVNKEKKVTPFVGERPTKEITLTNSSEKFLSCDTIVSAMQSAQIILRSGICPRNFTKPEQVVIALQYCKENNLPIISSLKNLTVLNGSIMAFGDLPLALVRRSGQLEYLQETFNEANKTATCKAKRKDCDIPVITTYSWSQAVRANLTNKDVWKQYPERMLKLRARAEALKDLFSDVLMGVGIQEYDDYNKPSQNKTLSQILKEETTKEEIDLGAIIEEQTEKHITC